MKVGIDLDGVCYEWQRTYRYMMNEYRGTRIPPVETFWDSWDAVDQFTSQEDRDWMWTEGVRLGLFRYGHVTTGAIVGLRRLIAADHSLYVVTHRPAVAVPDTLAWLNYINIPWTGVHILSNGESKSSIEVDVLVDDRTENVLEWALTGRPALVFDQPWNQQASATNVWRVDGWRGVTGVICSGQLRPK